MHYDAPVFHVCLCCSEIKTSQLLKMQKENHRSFMIVWFLWFMIEIRSVFKLRWREPNILYHNCRGKNISFLLLFICFTFLHKATSCCSTQTRSELRSHPFKGDSICIPSTPQTVASVVMTEKQHEHSVSFMKNSIIELTTSNFDWIVFNDTQTHSGGLEQMWSGIFLNFLHIQNLESYSQMWQQHLI